MEALKKRTKKKKDDDKGEAGVACWQAGWLEVWSQKLVAGAWFGWTRAAVGQRKSRSTAREGMIGGGQMRECAGVQGFANGKWKNENGTRGRKRTSKGEESRRGAEVEKEPVM